ncbi:MAG: CehA/McbA family metallohydrolase [Myxococcota bacterium]
MKRVLPLSLLALLLLVPACDEGSSDPSGSPDGALDAVEDTAEPDVEVPPDVATDEGGPDVEDVTPDVEPDVPAPPTPDLTEILADGEARAGLIEDEAALIPGPKADGRPGDVKLYNAHVAFVVEGVRRAGGYRYWGGSPVDMAVLGPDGAPLEDRYGEYVVSWNLDIFRPEDVEIVNDGTDGGPAHVRFTGVTEPMAFATSFIGDIIKAESPAFEVIYDYVLEPDARVLRLDITLTNPAPEGIWIDWPVGMASFGDGVFPFVPGPGYGVSDEPAIAAPWFGAVGRERGYGVMVGTDDLEVSFTYSSVTLTQRQAFYMSAYESRVRTMWYAPSANGADGVRAARQDLFPTDGLERAVEGTVDLPDTVAPDSAWVAVRQEGAVRSLAPVREDGSFGLTLPTGDYVVEAYADQHAPAEPVALEVTPAGQPTPSLVIEQAARVPVTVMDLATDGPVPARVTFERTGDTPSPYPPGDVRPAQKTWGGVQSAVALVTGPEEVAILPAGTYRVTASRGFSYEMEERTVTLSPGDNPTLDMAVERVIDTTGWLSSDFHIHAFHSPDSYTPYDIRVRQAATEDLDLPILTEHVVLNGLADTARDIGLDDEVIGITGQEVTSFAYGHFNAFPLVWRPDEPNNGAIFPHDKEAPALFEAIRAQNPGDEIIQVNHPRGFPSGSYFDAVGLDTETGDFARPEMWSDDWDTVEAFNGGCGKGDALDDWIGMTNRGRRKVLSSGSDTHHLSRPPGTPRNWIRVDEAAVRDDPQNLVPAVRDRKLFVSCGPFVEFEAVDAEGEVLAGLGDRAAVDADGQIAFRVRVQAPTWMKIDEARLWENGEVVDVIDVSAPADPIVRLDTVLEVTPPADAWYALEVRGHGNMRPMTFSGPPYALTNPIEVDADGDDAWIAPALAE